MKFKFFRKKIAVFILLFIAQLAFAQERVITGVVSDNAGLPLPGVSVLVSQPLKTI